MGFQTLYSSRRRTSTFWRTKDRTKILRSSLESARWYRKVHTDNCNTFSVRVWIEWFGFWCFRCSVKGEGPQAIALATEESYKEWKWKHKVPTCIHFGVGVVRTLLELVWVACQPAWCRNSASPPPDLGCRSDLAFHFASTRFFREQLRSTTILGDTDQEAQRHK